MTNGGFVAEYPDECVNCCAWIMPGDTVVYRRDGLAHTACPDMERVEVLVPVTGTPCPRCFCYHPGAC